MCYDSIFDSTTYNNIDSYIETRFDLSIYDDKKKKKLLKGIDTFNIKPTDKLNLKYYSAYYRRYSQYIHIGIKLSNYDDFLSIKDKIDTELKIIANIYNTTFPEPTIHAMVETYFD